MSLFPKRDEDGDRAMVSQRIRRPLKEWMQAEAKKGSAYSERFFVEAGISLLRALDQGHGKDIQAYAEERGYLLPDDLERVVLELVAEGLQKRGR